MNTVKNNSTSTDKQKLNALLWYADHSYPVFPCGADKQPLTVHGFKDATTDHQQIRRWNQTMPAALWAVATGAKKDGGAGIVVIDIDTNHQTGKNGFATWDAL